METVFETNFIPFSFSEKEARENFLDFIIKGDTTPIDAACTAVITKLTKQYYPVRCFYVTYSADWDATSIWEHKEEYVEYKTKTVYIDYRGHEQSSAGFDYEVINVKSYKRYRKPMEKTIPVKKKRIVVDHMERTNGGITDERAFFPVYIHSDNNQKDFAKWIEGMIAPGEYNPGEVGEQYEVQKLLENTDYARQIAEEKVKDRVWGQCQSQVPGSRHEEFGISNFSCEYHMDLVLVPIYHFTYTYGGASFECWRNGQTKESWFNYEKPQDSDIAQQNQQMEEEIKRTKSVRLKSGLLAFLGLPLAILICFLAVVLDGGFWYYIYLALAILAEIAFYLRFKSSNEQTKSMENAQINLRDNLREKRKSIAEVVKNPNLNEEEQKAAIREILNMR